MIMVCNTVLQSEKHVLHVNLHVIEWLAFSITLFWAPIKLTAPCIACFSAANIAVDLKFY